MTAEDIVKCIAALFLILSLIGGIHAIKQTQKRKP